MEPGNRRPLVFDFNVLRVCLVGGRAAAAAGEKVRGNMLGLLQHLVLTDENKVRLIDRLIDRLVD